MSKKSIPSLFIWGVRALLAVAVSSVLPAQAATISMTSNNNYFAGWVWNSFPVPPNTAYCPSAGSVPTNTVMQGLLNGQSFTVTDEGQAPITDWQLCTGFSSGTYIPAGTGLPAAVDSVNLTTGDLLLQSATPLPDGSFLGIEDMDAVESAHLTFKDCSGNVIDPSNFDTVILSSDYQSPADGPPMASSTYVPAAGTNPPQWVFAASVPPGNVPNVSLGLLMHSANICSIEINSPVAGTSGGFTFYLGSPAPIVSVAKNLDAATVAPVQANQPVIFDLTVSNAATPALTQPLGYQFYEVVPKGTTFTSISNGTTDCAPGAAAGTLCTITVSNAIAPGSSQIVKFTVTTEATLPAGTTEIFNYATQSTDVSPLTFGCTTSGSVCQFLYPGPTCPGYPAGMVCASAPTVTPVITLAKTVDVSTPDPVGPGQDVIFDLTATNSTPGTSGYSDPNLGAYVVWEIVPQNTTFKSVSSNASALCGASLSSSAGAPAGTLCYIQFTNPVAYGSSQTVQFTVTTVSPLPSGTTDIFNAATSATSDPTTGQVIPPPGCAFVDASGNFVMNCTTPPTGPSCPAGSSCASAPTVTSLAVTKTVSGGPAGYSGSFTITATCKDASGNDDSSMLTPSATQTVTAGTGSSGKATFGNVLAGDTCTVSEGALPSAPLSYIWSTPAITQPTGPITAPATASVANTLVQQVAGLTVVKTVAGGPPSYSGSFPVSVTCTLGGTAVSGITPSATQTITAGTGSSGQATFGNIPQGSQCTVSEGTLAAPPTSYAWGAPAITQPATIAASGSTATVANTLTQQFGALVVTKTVTGGPTGYSDSFSVSVVCTLSGTAVSGITPLATQSIMAGTGSSGQATFGNIPQGSQCTVSEGILPTPPTSYAWGTPAITQPAIIAASGSTATVANVLTQQFGSLTVTKTVTGGPASYSGSFPINVACRLNNTAVSGITPSATQNVAAGTSTGGQATFGNIPQGAQCTVSEGALPSAPTGYAWGTPAITQAGAIVANGSTATVANRLQGTDVQANAPPALTLPAGSTYTGGASATCTNNGPIATTQTTCTVTGLPPGMTSSCSPPPPAVLAVGASIVCTLSGTPTTPGTYPITVTTSDPGDTVQSNNTATSTITVAPRSGQTRPVPTPALEWEGLVCLIVLLGAISAASRRGEFH